MNDLNNLENMSTSCDSFNDKYKAIKWDKIRIVGNKKKQKINKTSNSKKKININNILLIKSKINNCLFYKNDLLINNNDNKLIIKNNFELILKYKKIKENKTNYLKNPFN